MSLSKRDSDVRASPHNHLQSATITVAYFPVITAALNPPDGECSLTSPEDSPDLALELELERDPASKPTLAPKSDLLAGPDLEKRGESTDPSCSKRLGIIKQ